MDKEEFLNNVRKISSSETSFDSDGWTAENPLWGHCAVVSLLAQELFGGELVQGDLDKYPKYKYLKSHFWNRIDGSDIDFTSEQYTDISYKDLKGEIVSKESILDYTDTIKRFNLLKERFNK